jgi:hypothetical protein
MPLWGTQRRRFREVLAGCLHSHGSCGVCGPCQCFACAALSGSNMCACGICCRRRMNAGCFWHVYGGEGGGGGVPLPPPSPAAGVVPRKHPHSGTGTRVQASGLHDLHEVCVSVQRQTWHLMQGSGAKVHVSIPRVGSLGAGHARRQYCSGRPSLAPSGSTSITLAPGAVGAFRLWPMWPAMPAGSGNASGGKSFCCSFFSISGFSLSMLKASPYVLPPKHPHPNVDLFQAAQEGDVAGVRAALAAGAFVNVRNARGETSM